MMKKDQHVRFAWIRIRRWQFSLKTVFIGVSIAACIGAWFGELRRRSQSAWDPIRTISSANESWIRFRNDSPCATTPMAKVLGIDFPPEPYIVRIDCTERKLELLRSVSKLPAIQLLQICSDNGLSDADLEIIASLPNLRTLSISCKNVTGTGMVYFKDNRMINAVHFRDCVKFGEEGISLLSDLPSLQHLSLSGCSVSDRDCQSFVLLKNLKNLDLSKTKVGDDIAIYLVQCDKLETVNLYGTLISDYGIDVIGSMSRLRNITVSKSRVTMAGVDRLKRMRSDVQVFGP